MCEITLSEKTSKTAMPIVVQKFINVSVVFTKQTVRISDLSQVKTSQDSAAYFRQFYTESEMLLRESFYFMALNRANRVLAIVKHSTGSMVGTCADIRLIFLHLIRFCAHAVIICHNHPSGMSRPSENDHKIVKKFKEAGKFLDIQLLDSIILTDDGYYSMCDEGEL